MLPRSLQAAAILLLVILEEQPSSPAPLNGKVPASFLTVPGTQSHVGRSGFNAKVKSCGSREDTSIKLRFYKGCSDFLWNARAVAGGRGGGPWSPY